MGSSRAAVLAIIIFGIFLLPGCGGKKSAPPQPAQVKVAPASASLEIGTTQGFIATATDSGGRSVTTSFTWQSSNTNVLDVANSGLACAGTWDSHTLPIVCTPGSAGTAQVVAVANTGGVSSAPVTVTVHQHIDQIVVTPVGTPAACLSQTGTQIYQAKALSNGVDITSTVGNFNWASTQTKVATVSTTASGLLPGQVQVTAADPGIANIFASLGTTNSGPVSFTSCPVASITLQVQTTGGTSVTLAKGGTKVIEATVLDSLGATITTPPLTWTSTQPSVVGVTGANGTGTIRGTQAGGAGVSASCTPPTCNIGFSPIQPIYPAVSIATTVTGSSTATTAYLTSSGCFGHAGCSASLFAVSSTATTTSSGLILPEAPNSLVFNKQGTRMYMGSVNGLMIFDPSANPPTININRSTTGKVLAISPDGNKVVVSDTNATPQRVFIFDQAAQVSTPLLITGATAAAFSPDSLKAYIAAGSSISVFSTQSSLKTVPLSAVASDVVFLPSGGFAYSLGGAPSGLGVVRTCDNAPQASVSLSATPFSLAASSDGTHLFALNPPSLDIVTANVTGAGCGAGYTVANSSTAVNLGLGTFTPQQMLVPTSGARVYVMANNLSSVLIYDVANGTFSSIPLSGSAATVRGDLSADGTLLFVTATDNTIHRLDTVLGSEAQLVTFPANSVVCSDTTVSCPLDLIAVRP
jgi:hypothetical protein